MMEGHQKMDIGARLQEEHKYLDGIKPKQFVDVYELILKTVCRKESPVF